MKIEINASALKQTRVSQVVVRFCLGGLITVAAGLIAKKYGAAVGGLFLAFPAIFPASATLIEKHERERKAKSGLNGAVRGRKAAAIDAAGAAIGSLGLLAFALLISRMISEYEPWLVMIGATIVWMATSAFLWYLRKHEWRSGSGADHESVTRRPPSS